jgi:hypothetical protein
LFICDIGRERVKKEKISAHLFMYFRSVAVTADRFGAVLRYLDVGH